VTKKCTATDNQVLSKQAPLLTQICHNNNITKQKQNKGMLPERPQGASMLAIRGTIAITNNMNKAINKKYKSK